MKLFSFMAAVAVTLAALYSTPSAAHEHKKMVKAGDLMISGIWARPTPPTAKTGAAYFVIKNTGSVDDVLIGVKGRVSKKTEIHETKMLGSVMKMQHVGKVEIPAGGTAALKPGSFHIMLMGLYGPIKKGDTFPLTLTFEKNGDVEIMVKASKAPKMEKMNHGTMEKMDSGKTETK